MSGRDVRRLAAHASNMTHEAKRDMVARVAAGADAAGATDIFVTREPFRIASMALEHMELNARVHVLEHPIHNDARDTEAAVRAFLACGCETIVSLGGDGTNRALVRALLEAGDNETHLFALSTGTNNVFPRLAEPTIVGMVAGYQANHQLAEMTSKRRVKVLHVTNGARTRTVDDIGLIDAVLLRRDHVGNLLPFDADRIVRLLLTRAEPSAIGMSPIGGLVQVIDENADVGLLVELGGDHTFLVPISPGLFQRVAVKNTKEIPFEVPVEFCGPGVLALDGDRDHKLEHDETLVVSIRRDGPWVVDVNLAMRWLVTQGIIAGPPTR
ncbi:MAG: diacylglycerol kinase family protein [Gammaproteobacteria bacterium]|nr:diacylglycerol kinase family protein [Gammaproteobacteria bacterium]